MKRLPWTQHWVYDGHFERRRSHATSLPLWEGELDLGHATAHIFGDPHGAMEVDASAPLVEWNSNLE